MQQETSNAREWEKELLYTTLLQPATISSNNRSNQPERGCTLPEANGAIGVPHDLLQPREGFVQEINTRKI